MTPFTCTHVLFDLDGTLVDSRGAVTECYETVFRTQLGQSFPPSSIDRAELFAMRPREVFARVAPERADALHDAYQAAYPQAAASKLRVFEHAAQLIEALVQAGRVPSLVTNKGLARARIDLSLAHIQADWFRAIVTSEDTTERKPHPDPVRVGMQRAGAGASDAVYVGDGPQDVLAAHSAGLPAIAVTYGFYGHEDLAEHRPEAVAHSVAELAEQLGVCVGERR